MKKKNKTDCKNASECIWNETLKNCINASDVREPGNFKNCTQYCKPTATTTALSDTQQMYCDPDCENGGEGCSFGLGGPHSMPYCRSCGQPNQLRCPKIVSKKSWEKLLEKDMKICKNSGCGSVVNSQRSYCDENCGVFNENVKYEGGIWPNLSKLSNGLGCNKYNSHQFCRECGAPGQHPCPEDIKDGKCWHPTEADGKPSKKGICPKSEYKYNLIGKLERAGPDQCCKNGFCGTGSKYCDESV